MLPLLPLPILMLITIMNICRESYLFPYPSVRLKSLIIFAHGSSSSRKSIRNRYVSRILNNNGFATLLTDLLMTKEVNSDMKDQKIMDNNKEESGILNKFNIHLLSSRLTTITGWVIENISEVKGLPIGYFGRSTGAAAASNQQLMMCQI